MVENRPASFEITNTRLSRPTNQIDRLVHFYCDGLGLTKIFSFDEDAAGYSGVVLGFPDHPLHLEFCIHRDGFQNCRPPTPDNLIVFYVASQNGLRDLETLMKALGYPAVPATNPHWDLDGITFEDPDGWRVVYMLRNNI